MKIQNQIKKCSYLIFFLILTIIITIPIILFNSNLEAQIIDAQVDIDPDTLNLSSTGIWITTYIVLPEGYHIEDIDVESIRLDDTIAPEMSDIQDNILMVKFNRQEVIDLIKLKGISGEDPLEVELKVNGYLNDGVTFFEGTDIIRFLWSYVCITIPYPLHGTTINELQPELMATYFPGKFEIDFDSFFSMLNEVDISSLYSVYSDKATYQVDTDLPIGQNNLEAAISDVKGNTDIAQSIFNVSPTNNPPIYYISIIGQKGIFISPADGTYSKYNIASGVNISVLYIQSFHSALDGSGFYFSLLDEEGIYYTPGDDSFELVLSSSDLGVQEHINALHIGFNNRVYFSTVGSGDIYQSSGDGTNTLYKAAVALGISEEMDLNSLYIATDGATDGKIYFSVTEDGRILESSGDGTNTIFFNPSTLGVPGYKINAFSVIPDDTAPDIQIDQPSDGSTVNSSRPNIVVSFEDKGIGINASGLDLTTFTASINGEDYSSHFTITQTGATYQPSSDLPGGGNTVTVGISDMAGNSASATSNFTVATVRAIPGATPTSGTAPLTVHFTTRGEDPSGTIEIYRWDFDGNGSWDTYDTVARDYNRTYYSSGTYNATLYVRSNSGITATASITITVLNNPPTATADVLPSNGEVPLTVSCNGSGSDPDGSIILYEWDFDGDGTYDWSSTTTGNTTHIYTEVGEYQAVFRVTDNFNQTDTAIAVTTVVRVGPEGSPTATASANPSTGNAPLTVNFTGTATDPDNNIVLYEWDFDGDGVYDWSSSTNGNTSHVYNEAGTHVASFRVTDSTGLTGIDQILIKVNINVSLLVASNTVGFLSAGMTASASSQYSLSFPPSNAIDNNTGTYWLSCRYCTPYYGYNEFFEVSFTTLQSITGLTLNCYSSAYNITKGRIEIYDINGNIIFSQETDFPNVISSISFPAVENAKRIRLFVLENSGYYSAYYIVIREFQVESNPMPGQQAEPTGTNINTSISAGTQVSIIIKDSQDNIVRTLVNNETRAKDSYSDYWDCKDDSGIVVNDGLYYAILQYILDGHVQTYDLTHTTGGTRNHFRYGSGCDQRDGSFKTNFSPFDDDFVAFNFRLCSAQEITMFVGPLWTGGDAARIRTLENRKVFSAGNHTIYWDGLDDNGNIAKPPSGDSLIVGAWRYTLPNNAICMTGGSPEIATISATPNYYSPFSEKCDQNGNGEGVIIDYNVSEDLAQVELRVYNIETGALLRTGIQNNIPAGDNTFFWDGKNNNGEYTDIGDYRVGLIARDVEGNESMWRYSLLRVDF